jgi:ABC-type dipeptide/oligopeptide/nickel transport system permease component
MYATIRFLLIRFIGLIFVLLALSFITFILGYFAPGDPIRDLMGVHFDPIVYAQLKHIYGLDLPWWRQYLNFLVNAVHGNFGLSFFYEGQSAWSIVQQGLSDSVDLGLEILIVTLLIGIPVGIITALRANTYIDTTLTTIMMLLYAIPDIALIVGFQLLMVWLFQNNLPYLPVAGWDSWQAHIGPVLITATTGAGYFTRLTRTTVLETMGQDFVRTAYAKGIRQRAVITRHVLRYSSIPIVTTIGVSLGYLVTGIFITEQFFNIPGVSQVTLDAIAQRDYPVIQATVLLTGASVVVFNLLTDVVYALIDPRVRLQ